MSLLTQSFGAEGGWIKWEGVVERVRETFLPAQGIQNARFLDVGLAKGICVSSPNFVVARVRMLDCFENGAKCGFLGRCSLGK